MTLAKTDAGQRMLKDRQSGLSQRQRAALILFNGQRSLEDVLAATSGGGVTRGDIGRLLELGLVAEQGPDSQPFADSIPPERERYLHAYRLAAELVARLGPRWSSLHLAVEGADSLDELQALGPRMETALGPVQFARLAPLLSRG